MDTFYYSQVNLGTYPALTSGGDTTLCPGESASLSVSGATSYSWSPVSGLNSTTSATPVATPTVSTTYTVIGTTGSCSDTEMVVVNVYAVVSPSMAFNGYQLSCTGTYNAYQWYLNNNPVAGATMQTYIPLTNGNYHVEVMDSNGCEGASNVILVLRTSAGQELATEGDLQIFPQPMTDAATIQFPYVIDNGVVELYSVSGEVLRRVNVSNTDQVTLEKNGLASGMYLLTVSCSNGRLRGRVIIE